MPVTRGTASERQERENSPRVRGQLHGSCVEVVTIAFSSSSETTCQAYWTKRRDWVVGMRDL